MSDEKEVQAVDVVGEIEGVQYLIERAKRNVDNEEEGDRVEASEALRMAGEKLKQLVAAIESVGGLAVVQDGGGDRVDDVTSDV